MTDFSDPNGASLRLSHAERDEAVSLLQANAHDGRLSEAELATRITAARSAVTRGDLAPLFADLPSPKAENSASAAPSGRPSARARSSFLALAPLVAVVLFFLTSWIWGFGFSWLWFLIVPIVYILAYGVEGGDGYRRERRRDRDSDHNR
jgi:hypothetical protein